MTRTRRGWSGLLTGCLAVVLGVAGCADDPAEPADPPSAGDPPAVGFRAEVTVRGQQLRISYRLVNRSGGDLLVLNRVPAYSSAGTARDDPNAVYVVGRPGTGTVQLGKRAFPRPDTDRKDWGAAPQVGAVVLPAGQEVAEEITVPLPLRRNHPYGDDIGYGVIKLPDPVDEVVFCLGLARMGEVPGALPSPGGPAVTSVPHAVSTTRVQHLFCSAPTML
ncbi:hypothetical protein [Catellatospora sichuanensis]|uniref:hypothetical protein n=1 Tax=Catellatospora sichuanensis TaxID=1969805 RepID=UPI001183B32E|nr:hypothetical protein [Catellatospora sichuanensis]